MYVCAMYNSNPIHVSTYSAEIQGVNTGCAKNIPYPYSVSNFGANSKFMPARPN